MLLLDSVVIKEETEGQREKTTRRSSQSNREAEPGPPSGFQTGTPDLLPSPAAPQSCTAEKKSKSEGTVCFHCGKSPGGGTQGRDVSNTIYGGLAIRYMHAL